MAPIAAATASLLLLVTLFPVNTLANINNNHGHFAFPVGRSVHDAKKAEKVVNNKRGGSTPLPYPVKIADPQATSSMSAPAMSAAAAAAFTMPVSMKGKVYTTPQAQSQAQAQATAMYAPYGSPRPMAAVAAGADHRLTSNTRPAAALATDPNVLVAASSSARSAGRRTKLLPGQQQPAQQTPAANQVYAPSPVAAQAADSASSVFDDGSSANIAVAAAPAAASSSGPATSDENATANRRTKTLPGTSPSSSAPAVAAAAATPADLESPIAAPAASPSPSSSDNSAQSTAQQQDDQSSSAPAPSSTAASSGSSSSSSASSGAMFNAVVSPGSSSWKLTNDWSGADFLNDWDFFTSPDPTHGLVDYLDAADAQSNGLAYVQGDGTFVMKVDSTTQLASGQNRKSVRITSRQTVGIGNLVIFDTNKIPYGPSTWPAFWTTGPNWPNGGEIDIVENVNSASQNHMTLHTSPGCTLSQPMAASGTVETTNCDANVNSNVGCSVIDPNTSSFGAGFAANGGGVWATIIASDAITIWFFPRGSVPSDITSKTPNPSAWGTPKARWASDTCSIAEYFTAQTIVINTTLCGDWANGAWAQAGVPGTCADAVANAANFVDADWQINGVTVYASA